MNLLTVSRIIYLFSNELIEELVAVNPNLVIANISGNAYAMPWLQKVPAILHISYLGTMGGASIADVISGKVNPSGKLPYSFPVKLSDCSAHFLVKRLIRVSILARTMCL